MKKKDIKGLYEEGAESIFDGSIILRLIARIINFFRWTYGLLFILAGVMFIGEDGLEVVPFIFLGISLLPPLYRKFKPLDKLWIKIVVPFICFIVLGAVLTAMEPEVPDIDIDPDTGIEITIPVDGGSENGPGNADNDPAGGTDNGPDSGAGIDTGKGKADPDKW